MATSKDYISMSTEELMVEEKKARKEQLLVAVLIGFMVGVLAFAVVFAVIGKDFRLVSILLPSAMVYVFYRMAGRTNQRMAAIRAELGKKRGA
jgi:tellurite resistance protein TehA-like permease